MALPTLTKTWEISSNNVVAVQADNNTSQRNLWLTILNFLKSKGWAVQAASNGTTASTATDLTTLANINWNANGFARSWIVLRNTALGATYDMLIDFVEPNNNAGNSMNNGYYVGRVRVEVAPGGYNVGGALSTTSRPSSSSGDEYVLRSDSSGSSNAISILGTANVAFAWHGWSSTDREVTRMAFYVNDILVTFFSFEKVKSPVANWTQPVVATFRTDYNGASIRGNEYYMNTWYAGRLNGTNTGLYLSGEGYTSGLVSNALAIPNEISSEYPLFPVGILSNSVPYRGRHGYLYDMWFAGGVPNGSTFPDGSGNQRKFIFNNCLVLPWDGSIPVIR